MSDETNFESLEERHAANRSRLALAQKEARDKYEASLTPEQLELLQKHRALRFGTSKLKSATLLLQ